MKIRRAGGVVASALRARRPRPAGLARLVGECGASAGAAVAVGSAGAGSKQVRSAVAEPSRLMAAGVGVALGPGFRYVRPAGARGDRQDSV